MELTRFERWMLSNQFKILERLDPDEADYYRRSREAVEQGYAREYVQFSGFDGNNESRRLGYCHYLIEDRHNARFHKLHRGDDFNSHMPVLDGYLRMIDVWRRITSDRPGPLRRDDLIAIVSERPHPKSEIGEAMRDKGPRH